MLRDWLREHPPPDSAFRQTVAGIGDRVLGGEPFLPAVWELLDEWNLLQTDAQRNCALADRPEPTGDRRYDAFVEEIFGAAED